MKLHANARTCPHSRRLAVDRVERAGLDACGGGRGRRRERAHGLEVAAPLPASRVSRACSIVARRRVGAAADARGASRGDRRVAPVADDRGGDRRDAGDAALDGVGDLDPDRARQALAAGAARAAEPLREEAAGRARPRRRQEARPDRPTRPPRHRRPAHPQPRDRLGVRARLRRRRDPARLRRGARRRESRRQRSASCAARSRTSPPTASGSSG